MLKKISVTFIILSSFCAGLYAQNPWTQRAGYGGGARAVPAGFSIGHYAFVGCGYNGLYLSDFWRYDIYTNTWTAIPSYPGQGQYACSAFTIEGKGYVCFGYNGSGTTTDLWRYDTITNAWTQMASLPGRSRYDASTFVLGHKAYLVGGSSGSAPYLNDVWVYDAHQNTWTQLANYPGGDLETVLTFAIGNYGYGGNGYYNPTCNTNMYRYDTTSDTWTPIAPIPISYGIGGNPRNWVIGSKAYVFNGDQCAHPGPYDGYVYDTVTKSWCIFTSMAIPKLTRGYCAALVMNNRMYMGTGYDTNLTLLGDWWEYTPSTKINVSDTNLCSSDSVHFSDSSTYLANSWSWSFPGGSPPNSNAEDPSVYYPSPGTYTATLILTACGGGDTVQKTITVIGGNSNMHIGGRSPICSGHPDTITASGGGTYLWSNGATTSSIIVSPAVTTTYSVQVTNGGCHGDTNITIIVDPTFSPVITGLDTICSGSPDNLAVTGGGSYLWSTGAVTTSITVSPAVTTTYSVKVTNGCTEDTSFKVTVLPKPVINISASNSTICSGDFVTFNATGAISYQWTPSNGLSCTNCPNPTASPTVTTNYIVTGTDSYGCTATSNFVLYVDNSPSLTVSPTQNICSGFSVNLYAYSGGGVGAFNWEPVNSSSSVLTISPATTTTYTVSYSNACGTVSDTVTVFVDPSPVPHFNADITSGCAPLCIQYRDLSTLTAGKITMWSWAFGNGDTVNEQSPIYCYHDTGMYSPKLTVISNNGCSATLQIVDMIKVFSKPIANFTYSPKPVDILTPTVQFTDQSTDIYGIAARLWNFGDGEVSYPGNSTIDPIHTYGDTGIFCPELIVENIKGCVDTVTNCLFVEPLFTLYIPSAFSPNGDGANDVFEPKGTYIKSFEMYVFDRWGMELYYTTDIHKGWDGTVHGGNIISQEDSYVYKITATDWSNTQHSYVGEVTLLK